MPRSLHQHSLASERPICSTCFPTRVATVFTLDTRRDIPRQILLLGLSDCAERVLCIQWALMPLVCPRKNTRFVPAHHRERVRSEISKHFEDNSRCSDSVTTGVARLPLQIQNTFAGRSGFFCCCLILGLIHHLIVADQSVNFRFPTTLLHSATRQLVVIGMNIDWLINQMRQ